MTAALDRRGFMAGLATLALVPPGAAATLPRRIAVLDWALLETILALGVTPVAAVELGLFRRLAVEPEVPQRVIDLGLRGSFNLELLSSVRPDLIYISPFNAWAEPQIARIAPTRSYPIFGGGQRPLDLVEAAMQGMGAELEREQAATSYIAGTRALIAASRQNLAGFAHRPVYLVNLGDARHVRVFGPDSLFGSVMADIGFTNAFTGNTRYAASAPIGIEAMAERPDAIIVVVGPVPPDAAAALPHSALWKAIPAVAAGRAYILPAMNAFGGLPTARRFTRLFEAALSGPAGG